ncbi:hypothetical protein HF319_08905 [Xanthomonas sp. Kuri4-1]
MSIPPSRPPSYALEIVIATVVGAAAGLWLDNLVVGSGIGIALGAVLSVLKMQRARRGED